MKFLYLFIAVTISFQLSANEASGSSKTIQLLNSYKSFGNKKAESFLEVCNKNGGYISGYLGAYNENSASHLQCINKKIAGMLALGSERYYFKSGEVYRVQDNFHWGLEIDIWYYNGSSAIVTFGDGVNRLKFSVSDLNSNKLSIEEVILPAYERIQIYNNYLYPEYMIDKYYLENYSQMKLQDFTGDLFHSSVTKQLFIKWLKAQDSNT